jgi:hypothetical protein
MLRIFPFLGLNNRVQCENFHTPIYYNIENKKCKGQKQHFSTIFKENLSFWGG